MDKEMGPGVVHPLGAVERFFFCFFLFEEAVVSREAFEHHSS